MHFRVCEAASPDSGGRTLEFYSSKAIVTTEYDLNSSRGRAELSATGEFRTITGN
jgi:hypothetical protein